MRIEPKNLARRLGGVVVTLLALGPAVIVAAPAAQAYTPSAATVAAYEARVIYRMNVIRASKHLRHLYVSRCPDRYAESWAAYLARTNTFYHRSMYAVLAGCGAHVAAENLVRGNVSADRVVALWMASSGHRANVLDYRLSQVGVAAVYARGQWTVAANFTRP
jgi:uncharacterized protein YkwD